MPWGYDLEGLGAMFLMDAREPQRRKDLLRIEHHEVNPNIGHLEVDCAILE